jgi:prepilin-type N-terminal cleavage/methylation domain-containing protein
MKKAFSLIELIIVLAVIGILAAILIPVISNAVDKANAKAALSDARNALTGYESYAQANEMSSADVVFIVLKAKRLYVYGLLAGSGKLSESVNNPYELESKDNTDISAEAQALLEKLLDNGSVIPSPSQNQVNITEKLADTPCTVQVFYGYRLQSFKVEISFEKSVLDLAIDDIERLTVFTDPETDIEFISSDPEIVSVNEFGIATAKALGSVTITATNGFVSAYCKVNVLDYIEAGTLEELKHLFENTGTQTVFIRIINSYGFGDVSLLPLCVSENKYDDKNTLTNYVAYCESNQKPQRNTCFIAQKAKAHYAFGCFKGANEHIESKNNPYKADSLQDAVNMLIDTESMVQLGAGSKNITNILPEVPENVLVYEGYSLTPIADQALLSKSRIGLYPTETYTLSTTLLPDRQV